MAKRYRVLTGINYKPKGATVEKRAEVGAVVDDLPPASVGWLLAQRIVEEVTGSGAGSQQS